MTAPAGDPLHVWITPTPVPGAPPGRRLGIKDLFDTAGVRTTYGSALYGDHVPDRDASAVTRLLDAGWAGVGKTNLHEFAFGVTSENPWYGAVGNPHDPTRVAGGSSGGSAAGLLTGDFDLGLGTDTAGSIRIPASACGVVGFKPAFAAVPLDGCFPLVPWLDHGGPMARTVGACVEAFAILADRAPAVALDVEGLRAVAIRPEGVQDDIAAAVAAAVDRMREAGLDVTDGGLDVTDGVLPPLPDDAVRLRMAAAAEVHAATFPARRERYGAAVARLLDLARDIAATLDRPAAEAVLAGWRTTVAARLAPYHLLVLPTLPITPPRIGDPDPRNRNRLLSLTQPFNFLGLPAVTVPCGTDTAGMPVGLQIVGHDDDVVLGAALTLEPVIRPGGAPAG